MVPLVHFDPISLQNEGFRLAAAGQLREALTVFDKAVVESEGKNASLITVDPKLITELQRYKLVFMFEGGIAAARNNRGVLRFLTGNLAGAQEDLDYAAVASPDTPLPWINAALVLLAQNRASRAEVSAQGALLRGRENARARAILAEVNFALGRMSLAKEDAELAVKLAPNDPYGLFVLSQTQRASGQAREADRSLIQALSLEPRTAVGSPLAPISGLISTLGGNAREQIGRFQATGPQFRVRGQRIQLQIDGRENALQTDELLETTLGIPGGKWAGYFVSHRSAGGRPGGDGFTPNATYRLGQERLSLVHHDSRFAFHAGYHNDAVVTGDKSGPIPADWPLQDKRAVVEGQFVDRGVNAGVSWSQNWRQTPSGTINLLSPIQPAEQVLPGGRWSQSVGWAFVTRTLNERMNLTVGPVAVLTRRATVVMPFVDLAIKGITPQASHFRILSRVAEAGGDFFPQAARAKLPQDNNIDRSEETGQSINRSPLIAGPEGRIVETSFNLAWALFGGLLRPKTANPEGAAACGMLGASESAASESAAPVKGLEFNVKLFHQRMNDIYIQSADSRLASNLILTPVTHAEATGIQQSVRLRVVKGLEARFAVQYQEAYGRVPGESFDAVTFNSLTPRGLSNFPRWQTSGRLDTTLGEWGIGGEINLVGKRPVWRDSGGGRGVGSSSTATAIDSAGNSLGLNLMIKRRFLDKGEFSLSLFNLGSASFYPGSAGALTGISGFSWRF